MFQGLYGGANDFDAMCDYPKCIEFEDYKESYERDGIANKVVSILPSECFSVHPMIYETEMIETRKRTKMEDKWDKLEKKHGIIDKIRRLDEVSGIGHYGVMLVGINDKRSLDQPVEGINGKTGEVRDSRRKERDLLYLMPFDEGEAQIIKCDETEGIRRGKPLYYEIQMADPRNPGHTKVKGVKVHWTRCIHVADGCTSNDVFGSPRQKKVWNYLLNGKKVLGGSAEMFKNGGFPGTAFTVPPEFAGQVDLDKEELAEELEKYYNGFKRYLSLSGVEAHQLMPNIAAPKEHWEIQLEAICISIEVPLPIFKGAEEGRMASLQNGEAWNKRVHRRYDNHVNPRLLRPTIDLFMNTGILPMVDEYYIWWPDLYAISQKDKADVTGKLVRALSEYVKNGVFKLIPPLQFFNMFMDLTPEQGEEIIKSAKKASKSKDMKFMDELVAPIAKAKSDERNRQGTRRPALGTTPKIKGRGK